MLEVRRREGRRREVAVLVWDVKKACVSVCVCVCVSICMYNVVLGLEN